MFYLASIIISLFSLFISIWAINEAQKARGLNFRNIKSLRFDKYGNELREIHKNVTPKLEKLTHEAFTVYNNIGKELDSFSVNIPARHLLYDFIKEFWDINNGNIGKNTSLLYHPQFPKIVTMSKSEYQKHLLYVFELA